MLPLHVWNSFWKTRPSQPAATSAPAETTPKQTAAPSPALPPAPDALTLTAEEKYDLLSEFGGHVLCLLTQEGNCRYVSRNFESITGLSRSALLGKTMQELLHTDFHERFATALKSAAEGGSNLRGRLQHADGKWQWYQFLVRPRAAANTGEFVCVMENIHDMIAAQNTLQKARLEAELALRARSEFLANMSHELRTPLNAVIGFSQIIESEIFGKINNPQYKDYIRHIQDSGYDLLAKIEDLLEIANIDAGRVSLSKEDVLLADVLRHVTQAQNHHAEAAGVVLECQPPKQDVMLHVDRLKLQHILGHLVSNAIRHSEAGGTVSLVARQVGGGLEVAVQDTGAGMQQDKLGAILTALQEENCWTNANEHGAVGLGLALTREFVALHGGQVDVESLEGEGTTVLISLPKTCLRAPAKPELELAKQAV